MCVIPLNRVLIINYAKLTHFFVMDKKESRNSPQLILINDFFFISACSPR